jgi:hypothetical protein
MASYQPNKAAVAHARSLVDARRCVLGSDRGDPRPGADARAYPAARCRHGEVERAARDRLRYLDGTGG